MKRNAPDRRSCSIRRTIYGVVIDWASTAGRQRFRVAMHERTDNLFVSRPAAVVSLGMIAAKTAIQTPGGKELMLRTFRCIDDRLKGIEFVYCGSCGCRVWIGTGGKAAGRFEGRCVQCGAVPNKPECPAWHAYGRCPSCPVCGPDEVQP